MRNRTELHFIILEEKKEIFMQCLNGSEPYAVLKFFGGTQVVGWFEL